MTRQVVVSKTGKVQDLPIEDLPATKINFIKYMHLSDKFAYATLMDGRDVAIPQRALSQLLNKLKMTYKELDWRTAAAEVSEALEIRKNDLIFRMRGKTVLAVVTKEYVDIGIGWIQDRAEEAMKRLGYKTKSRQIRQTKHAVHMRYIFYDQMDCSKEYQHEIFEIGVLMKTSRLATSSIYVEPYLKRSSCDNSMVILGGNGDDGEKPKRFQVHRGKHAADKEAVVETVQGMIKSAVESIQETIPAFLENAKTRFAYDTEIDHVLGVHFPLYFSKAAKDQIRAQLKKDYGANLWDVYNALTYVASHHPRCVKKVTVHHKYVDEAFKAVNHLMRMVDNRTKTESPRLITER